ncbi:cryptochrome-1 [Dorcoceras hygrometricum]|uniref:Cryptochrome-1 n=1 Tax=Dorcoceras hygrometricum TaxID=472368 RepID=A0A2Z7C9L6_9LAMI|nr:cryptochrome-1 [Dorcoceras hygrometricum]
MKVVYNHLYDPVSLVRDHYITQKLGETGVSVQSYNAELLHEPWEVYDDNGNAFTTFDAYCDHKCLKLETGPGINLPPCSLVQATGNVKKCLIDELGLEDESEKSSNALLGRVWSPGWANADKAFTRFIENHLLNYSKDRFRLHGNCTSLLSPYLHFGELSVRKLIVSVLMKQAVWRNEKNFVGVSSANHFLKAMRLREYSRYICFNFPFTHERPLLSSLKYFPWSADQANFKAWRQGRTGYPLVDAGMRELWATGWIHNRIRVIVSSFFVKFLVLPWQWGIRYFWDTLLDADLENDILGWQYISGSLPDGHALERMDIPQVQGFKYDPDGDYIRQWLPELAQIPCEWIHHPYDAPEYVLESAGVDLGSNYPKPIIDIDLARARLTECISIMRGKELSAKADGLTEEQVFDNYDTNVNLSIPSAVVKGKISLFPDAWSRYQQDSESLIITKKKEKSSEGERLVVVEDSGGERSKMDDELRSTAESCFDKRQATSSATPFPFPLNCSSNIPGAAHLHTRRNHAVDCQESFDV